LEVDLTGGAKRGYVILREPITRDTVLAPTRRVIGVEDPFLYSAEAPNYLEAAWRARSFLAGPDGKPVDRERVALAVNSGVVRSQDQLHIHIGCLLPDAERVVRTLAPRLRLGEWAQVGPIIPHSMFWAMRIGGSDLASVQPFALAADYFGDRLRTRADLMVAVVPVRAAGDDDFLILASHAHAPHAWWPVGAEDLLDTSCSAEPRGRP
jgi:CDP-diacylglycerol pyrophosphatase